MVMIIFCEACSSGLHKIGIANSLYLDICECFVNHCTPCHSSDPSLGWIDPIIFYLESNGYIVTTEGDKNLLFVKPTGLTYDCVNGTSICRICPNCKPTRTNHN